MISIDEQDNNLSLSQKENEIVEVKNDNSNLNETNDYKLLRSIENTEILAVSSSNSVLTAGSSSSSATVTQQSSSNYIEPTLKQRTIKIGGFKAVLSKAQYKKFYRISDVEDYFFDNGYNNYYYVGEKFNGYDLTSTGLRYMIVLKTNKYIKVKVKIGKNTKLKNTSSNDYIIWRRTMWCCLQIYGIFNT